MDREIKTLHGEYFMYKDSFEGICVTHDLLKVREFIFDVWDTTLVSKGYTGGEGNRRQRVDPNFRIFDVNKLTINKSLISSVDSV